MRKLNRTAQLYILSTNAAGIVLLALILTNYRWQNAGLLLGLSGLASFALIFKVEGSTNRSHYNFSFLVYAFTFIELGPEPTALVVLISNQAEWIWYRYPWYIPSFNALSLSIVFYLSGLLFDELHAVFPLSALNAIAAIALVFAVVTLGNHLMVGLVIWFARNENLNKSGVFEFFPIMLDFTLLCLGAGTALLWERNPFAVVLTLLPVYLI